MQNIEPPDTHHISAALGWLGLGNIAEAKAELALALANQKQQAVKDRDITAAMAQVAKSKAGLTSAHTQLGYVTIVASILRSEPSH